MGNLFSALHQRRKYTITEDDEDFTDVSDELLCSNSIKHYALDINHFKHTYAFGIAQFDSIDELSEHFKCMPVLGSESGTSVTLRHPYKHDIPEPTQYEHVVRHAELGKQTSFNQDMAKPSPDLHIASKEGYLIKRGAIHKNWKKRWFVLQKNLLKYYKEKEESTPIKTIDLVDAMHAVEDFCDGRNNCFRLAMPTRIFYFVASSPSEAKSWIELLQWKIEYYQERKTNQSKTRLNNNGSTSSAGSQGNNENNTATSGWNQNDSLFVSFPAIR